MDDKMADLLDLLLKSPNPLHADTITDIYRYVRWKFMEQEATK